jgi:hypothetical protein
MQYTHVYKEITPTYQEMAQVLTQLGYKEETNSTFFLFVNEKHQSEVKLPYQPYDTPFMKANLAGFSYLLYMQGVIKDQDKLAKMIEKNRLAAAKKEEKQAIKSMAN